MNDHPELKRVRDLLVRAVHASTPEEEARSCALLAARAIVKHGFEIVAPESESDSVPPAPATADPFAGYEDRPYVRHERTPEHAKKIWDTFEKRAQRRGAPALYTVAEAVEVIGLVCAKCGSPIPPLSKIARNLRTVTHYDCRDFFHPHPPSCRCASCAARKTR